MPRACVESWVKTFFATHAPGTRYAPGSASGGRFHLDPFLPFSFLELRLKGFEALIDGLLEGVGSLGSEKVGASLARKA